MNAYYHTFSQVFSPDECEEIIALGKAAGLKPGTVTTNRIVDEKIRKSEVSFLTQSWASRFIYDCLAVRIVSANDQCFFLDLSNRPFLDLPSMQFTEYKAEGAEHYDWHTDNFWVSKKTQDRKVSCCVQLSAPEDYEGGRLEIEGTAIPSDRFICRGDIIVFPSCFRHRVTPVTSGIRHSLVTWAYGPRFK